MNFFTGIFLNFFFVLLFRNTYVKEHFLVAASASVYFNREASQKC